VKNKDSILPIQQILPVNSIGRDNPVDLYKIFIRLELLCIEKGLESLSACQIGVSLPLFVFKRNGIFEYYFNCRYIGRGEKISSIEECVSISNSQGKYKTFELARFFELDIEGKRLDIGKSSNNDGFLVSEVNFRETGKNALIFQHEIDHCSGISLLDIGKEINLF
jgi:peptide deformylase